jgi:hypothetical protein
MSYDEAEVPVGCVLVRPGVGVVAEGRNRPNATQNVRPPSPSPSVAAALTAGTERLRGPGPGDTARRA